MSKAEPARFCPTTFLICPLIEAYRRTVVAMLRRTIGDPDVLSIPVLDRKPPSHSVTSAIKTLAKSEGARSGPREPGKAMNL